MTERAKDGAGRLRCDDCHCWNYPADLVNYRNAKLLCRECYQDRLEKIINRSNVRIPGR
jgi:formylmethanofuran dehydrogenase subunit E